MASVQIGTSLNNPNTSDILIPKNFTLSANATFKGTLNLQSTTSVTLPPAERTLINGVVLSSTISTNGVPIGSIAIWYTSTDPPTGWVPCDGRTVNGMTIPDLTGRFVMCASTTYPVNDRQGSSTKSVTISNFPSHNHNYNTGNNITTNDGGGHTHTIRNRTEDNSTNNATDFIMGRAYNNGASASFKTTSSGAHAHTNNPNTNTVGSGTAFNILPPYHSLIYIIKLS
jgi:microcystin-dependent protein